jgi:hypothetical protein
MVVSEMDMLLTLPQRHAQLLNAGLPNQDGLNQVYAFPRSTPRLEAHLYWHKSVENDPANRWLREEIVKALVPARLGTEVLRSAGRERQVGKGLVRDKALDLDDRLDCLGLPSWVLECE